MTTIPPPEPRHGITELLRLVGAVRRLAFDRTLPASEAMGRIRDAYRDYDEGGNAGPGPVSTAAGQPEPTRLCGAGPGGRLTPQHSTPGPWWRRGVLLRGGADSGGGSGATVDVSATGDLPRGRHDTRLAGYDASSNTNSCGPGSTDHAAYGHVVAWKMPVGSPVSVCPW